MISLSGDLPLITALMLCGIGAFIFSRNPKAAVNRLFAGGMLALVLADAARLGLANSSGASSLVLWQSVVLAASDEAERQTIVAALQRNRGNISRAASEIGVSRPTLHALLNKHNLQPAEYRQR